MLCVRCIVLAAALCVGARAQDPVPRLACPRDHIQHCQNISVKHDHYSTYNFVVNGINVTYKFREDDGYLSVSCGIIALDDPALPRFEPALRVRRVRLKECWPRIASYAAALSAINMTGLEAPSFEGANALPTYDIQLELREVKQFNMTVLTTMSSLRNLTFFYTNVYNADLSLLPTGLERLTLMFTKINRILATTLMRLPGLTELIVITWKPTIVETAGNLIFLLVNSPATTLQIPVLSLPKRFKQLELRNWTARTPLPWLSCAGLDTLIIRWAAINILPEDWLARCVQLRTLCVTDTINMRLTAGALRGAAALEEVSLTQCQLKSLPAGLLDDARALRVLDLQGNRLHTLPGGLFRHSQSLSVLKLSGNRLTDEVLDVLDAAPSLSELDLSYNTVLDACPDTRHDDHTTAQGWAPMGNLKNLTVLLLANTATRYICASWQQMPHLEKLNLSYTAIRVLKYTDLVFESTVNITVALSRAELSLRHEDYWRVAARLAGPTLTLQLALTLRCDCELYWAAVVLRLPNSRLREEGARCENQRSLSNTSLDELLCPALGPCPEGCACNSREDVERPGRLLQVNCERAALRNVPHIDARATLQYEGVEPINLDLRLARNTIFQLTPEDFPPELMALDLRYNKVQVIDEKTMAALVRRNDRSVWLANNPLDCSCNAAKTLVTMRRHRHMFRDWFTGICSHGTHLILAELQFLSCKDAIEMEPENQTAAFQDNTSETVLQYTTQPALQSVPDHMTDAVLEYTTRPDLQSMPENTSEGVLEYTTRSSLQSMPENASEGELQYTTALTPAPVAAGMSWGAVTALAIGAGAAGAVIVTALWWYSLRRQTRVPLRAHPSPLRFERRRPNSDEWAYDAFVSFAHKDEAIARELVERLESGPVPLRLCVHYRDWMPGGWIPAQISASVRVSRRTVAIVSEAFLRSKWARAEFREAYAAALEDSEPRLVLVLLENPARLPLDVELRAYISGNTYVRWDDPWFWRKLRRALPAPSPRPVAAAAAASPAPAPPPPPLSDG